MDNNYSKQREIILDVIKNIKSHPTIEELCNLVYIKDNTISKSTIYRNVNILVNNNIIKKISMPNGAYRYDYIHTPHHHVICSKCQKIMDFEYDFTKNINIDDIENQTSSKIDLNFVTIHGICNNCLLNKNLN